MFMLLDMAAAVSVRNMLHKLADARFTPSPRDQVVIVRPGWVFANAEHGILGKYPFKFDSSLGRACCHTPLQL